MWIVCLSIYTSTCLSVTMKSFTFDEPNFHGFMKLRTFVGTNFHGHQLFGWLKLKKKLQGYR